MRPIVCFIDDARFELENFREHAAWAFEGLEIIYAHTFEEARRQLDGRRPLGFLLDIYGATSAEQPQGLPPRDELARALSERMELEGLYEGLKGAGSEDANTFLRRLHGWVSRLQGAFDLAAGHLGQSRAYGLENLQQVRRHYPWAAAVGYSRKSSYADAAAMCAAGADGVLIKPQGEGAEAIAEATRAQAPEIFGALGRMIDRRLIQVLGPVGLRLCVEAEAQGLAEAIVEGLRHLGAWGLGEPRVSREEAVGMLEGVRLEEGMSATEREALLCLRDWLEVRPR